MTTMLPLPPLPPVPYWSVPTRVLLSITMIIIMLLALFGNSLVIIVLMKNRGMRTRTNMFLCNLAVTDLLCALLDMPFSLVTVIRGEWIFGGRIGEPPGKNYTDIGVNGVCYFNGFSTYFFWVTSIHTLMYTAVFKYATIKNPFSAALNERTVACMLGASWLWAAVIGYLSINGLTTAYFQNYTTQCGPHYSADKWTYAHFAVVMGTCYVIPLLVIFFCYALMFLEIMAHSQRMSQSSDVGVDQIFVQQKRVGITLVLMIVAFVVCWTPWICFTIYDLFFVSNEPDHLEDIDSLVNPITFWFGYANSACNPIIYALRSDAFKEGFRQTLLSRKSTTTGYDVTNRDSRKPLQRRDTTQQSFESSFKVPRTGDSSANNLICTGTNYQDLTNSRSMSTESTSYPPSSPSAHGVYFQDSLHGADHPAGTSTPYHQNNDLAGTMPEKQADVVKPRVNRPKKQTQHDDIEMKVFSEDSGAEVNGGEAATGIAGGRKKSKRRQVVNAAAAEEVKEAEPLIEKQTSMVQPTTGAPRPAPRNGARETGDLVPRRHGYEMEANERHSVAVLAGRALQGASPFDARSERPDNVRNNGRSSQGSSAHSGGHQRDVHSNLEQTDLESPRDHRGVVFGLHGAVRGHDTNKQGGMVRYPSVEILDSYPRRRGGGSVADHRAVTTELRVQSRANDEEF